MMMMIGMIDVALLFSSESRKLVRLLKLSTIIMQMLHKEIQLWRNSMERHFSCLRYMHSLLNSFDSDYTPKGLET